MGWSSGGGDEVRAAALKHCQEVCVWANELGEEALSQEAWPRERPVVLASPPHTHPHYNTTHTHTHVTTLHTLLLCWSHNTLFPGQHHRGMCTHPPAVHAFISKQRCDAKYLWHNKVWRVVQTQIFLFGKCKQRQQVKQKFKPVEGKLVHTTRSERSTFTVICCRQNIAPLRSNKQVQTHLRAKARDETVMSSLSLS